MKNHVILVFLVLFNVRETLAIPNFNDALFTKTSLLSYIERDEMKTKNRIHCTIETDLSKQELKERSYQVQSKITNFATLLTDIDELENLYRDSAVKRVLFLQKDEPLLDESTSNKMNGVNYVGCNADFLQSIGLDGTGVIIGILDYVPLNWKHEDFFTTSWESNDLRILEIWDQRNDTGPHPDGFDYGTLFTKADLMANNGPAITAGDHGTQCTGIAAGDGSGSGIGNPRMGMAPKAEIIYVRKIGYSEDTIDALAYFEQKATEFGKPIVVSFSGGTRYGITDGSDPSSIALAEFGGEGRIAVIAAGNYYSTTKHAQSSTTFGSPTTDLTYQITAYTNSGTGQFDDFIDTIFYFRYGDNFDISVTDPFGQVYTHLINAEDAYFNTDYGRLYILRNDYPSIEVVITDEVGTVTTGDIWTIGLSCPDETYDDMGGTWSAWFYEKNITANFTNYGTGENTLNIYAAGGNSLSVGAHVKTNGALYSLSSSGFTIDGRIKPDITAPTSAVTTNNSGTNTYSSLGATSGAAPHAAGLAALLYQLYPSYSPEDIIPLFHSSAWGDNYTNLWGSLPNIRYGYGKMNAPGVYQQTAIANSIQNVNIDNQIYLFDETGVEIKFTGLAGSQSISVSKFGQAPWNHDISENYISNYRWVLTGTGFDSATLYFDIAQLSGISNPHSVNIFRRTNEGNGSFGTALVTSVENNYIVVTVDEFSEFVLAGNDNPLPVTLAYFNATFHNGTGILQWQTYSETNNAGWNMYRNTGFDSFQNAETINIDGLIPGAGTSFTQYDYQFSDSSGLLENTTCYYWLESISYAGESTVYAPVSLFIPDDYEMVSPEITFHGLQQNYPNPFNPETIISFSLNSDTYGELSIYNIKGEKVLTLYQGEILADKLYKMSWNGLDKNKKKVASSIYFYQLKTNHFNQTKKMMILK
jgi:hypothetical protein